MFSQVSCDWLTVTAKPQTEADWQLQAVYDGLGRELLALGEEEKAMRAMGYTGSRIGSAFIGNRPDSRIVRVSGPYAHKLLEQLIWLKFEGNITRIDLQATWEFDTDRATHARDQATQVEFYQAANKLSNPPRITLIQGFGNGDTLMVGSRSSEKYVRVYDKTREQARSGPPWLWRYEVELKGSMARAVFEYLKQTTDLARSVLWVVSTYCDNSGIIRPWTDESSYELPITGRPTTSDEKSLNWLRESVRATVRRLVQHGLAEEVYESLGLVGPDGLL
jgi:DNA relaxase NicK